MGNLTLAVPQLFVLVSTGQNVANLPPVLEHAEAGDWIVWVESDLARCQDWARGARQVLKQRGLRIVEASIAVRQINDPVQVAAACRGFLEGWKHNNSARPFALVVRVTKGLVLKKANVGGRWVRAHQAAATAVSGRGLAWLAKLADDLFHCRYQPLVPRWAPRRPSATQIAQRGAWIRSVPRPSASRRSAS